MTLRKPLVVVNGQVRQMSAEDTLDASVQERAVFILTNGETEALIICTPVYVSAAGTCKKAQANASGTTEVIGLCASPSVAAAAAGSIQSDGVLVATTAQWDAVAGTTGGLAFNALYYLDPTAAGTITATAPTTGGQYLAPLGRALGPTDLEITVSPTILL
ncbi:MAG: hypothetical protein WCI67_15940 [Chloroflexales bacterium]